MDCGAVQSGALSWQACGGGYQFDPLDFRALYKAYAGPLRRFVRRLAADRVFPESLVDTDGIVHDTFVVLLSGSGQPIRNPDCR
jgi:DNA-directed RNA polymerase specialized sigma24 family protein